jgi:5-methylcytosine-specific restriction endonuclease McrA
MGARQREWARRWREKFLDFFDRRCAWCGAAESADVKLTLDVICPTDEHKQDHHRKMDWSHRMSYYRQQAARDNLQCLCVSCNSKKGQDTIRFVKPELDWSHLGRFEPF